MWTKLQCHRGDSCKYLHEGPGACVESRGKGKDGRNGAKQVKDQHDPAEVEGEEPTSAASETESGVRQEAPFEEVVDYE